MSSRSNPPGSFRFPPHFENAEVEQLSRLAMDGLKDATDAIKALNKKANSTAAQSAASAAALALLSTLVQQITNNITNLTTIINNTVGAGGNIDCGTFEAIYSITATVTGRLIEFQALRGTETDLQQALPLGWGEFYFAADTGNLFMGTPGFGIGYVQIGDLTGMNDTLLQILKELQIMRKVFEKVLQQLGGEYVVVDSSID